MKKVINTLTLIVLLSTVKQEKVEAKVIPVKKDVTFEVVLDHSMNQKPYLVVFENGNIEIDHAKSDQKRIEFKSNNGYSYFFELKNQIKPLHFSLRLKDKLFDIPVVNMYHFEPGDRIRILVKSTNVPNIYNIEFSGHGSAKYRCKNEFNNVIRFSKIYEQPKDGHKLQAIEQSFKSVNVLRKLIEKYQPEMSDYSFHLLNAEVIATYGLDIIGSLEIKAAVLKQKKDTAGLKRMAADISIPFGVDFTKDIPDTILRDAFHYSEFMIEKFKYENLILHGDANYPDVFRKIEQLENIPLRNKMILEFMLIYSERLNDSYEKVLEDAINIIKDPYYLARIKDFNRHISGTKAYNFSLQDVNGKIVKMDDFKGKIVFIDFWFTGCTFCKQYYKYVLTDVESLYKENSNVVFITISIDKEKEDWLKSINDGKYTSSSAINLFTNGEGHDNGIIQYYNVTTYPRPMLVNRKGEIISFTGNKLRNKQGLIDEINKALKNND